MKLSLLTWNSISINTSAIKCTIPPGQMLNLSSNPVTVNRAFDFPYLSGTVLQPKVFVIEVYIPAGQNINTNRELLKKYFNITDPTRHNLIAQDENDSNKQYYLTGYPVRLAPQGSGINEWTVAFQVEYPYWRLVTASVDSWDVTASSDSFDVTNSGNINVHPIFTITPTTTKTKGLKYRRYIPIYNNLTTSYISPYEITNGGLDVQSLINAGKMQSDGDDFRIWEDGKFKDRWLYEMDSDSDPAKCWVNEELSPLKAAFTLSTFDSDDTTMFFTQTRTSKTFLREMKSVSNPTLLIDSDSGGNVELVTFDPDNIDLLNYKITNLSRSAKTSVATPHLAGVTVRHIEHDTWLLYGDSDLGSQSVDSDFQPILDLSSTNTLWGYTNFFDRDSNRPGSWQPEILATKTGLSNNYTGNQGALANPSTELGLSMEGTADFQVANEAGTLDWLFYHPAGMSNVKYSGDYRTGDSDDSWPGTVGLQYLQNNGMWKLAYVDSDFPPTFSDSWIAFDSFDISLGSTYNTIRFVMDGQLNSVQNAKAQWQADTIFLTLTNVPTSSMLAETSINFFDFTLTNSTTSEYIKVQCPCPLNMALTIDCEAKEAYLADGTRVLVTLSSNRNEWLDLASGVNHLNYVDDGTVAVHVNITHRDRVL